MKRLLTAAKQSVEKGKIIKGRQWLHMLYYSSRTSKRTKHVYSIKHLHELQWYGDDDMEKFIARWEYIISGMESKPSEEEQRDILIKQMRHSSKLQHDVAHFDRIEDNDSKDNSFAWLVSRIDRCIEREEILANEKKVDNDGKKTKKQKDNPAAPAGGGFGGAGFARSSRGRSSPLNE